MLTKTDFNFPAAGTMFVYDTRIWWYYDKKRNEIVRSHDKKSLQAWWGTQAGLIRLERFGPGQDCFSDEDVEEIHYSPDGNLAFVSFKNSDDIEMFFTCNQLVEGFCTLSSPDKK